MTDTSPEIQTRVATMMMAKTGVERLKMGLSMFDMAKRLVIASITASGNSDNIHKQLLLRFYQADLGPKMIKKILGSLDSRSL